MFPPEIALPFSRGKCTGHEDAVAQRNPQWEYPIFWPQNDRRIKFPFMETSLMLMNTQGTSSFWFSCIHELTKMLVCYLTYGCKTVKKNLLVIFIQSLCINTNKTDTEIKKRCGKKETGEASCSVSIGGDRESTPQWNVVHHLACPYFRILKELNTDTRVM